MSIDDAAIEQHPIATDRSPPASIRSAFDRDGFFLLEDALSAGEIDMIRAEALAVCRGERGACSGLAPVQADETDAETLSRILCIHHPHKLSPVMADAMKHPAIVAALTSIIGPNVKAMQSMLFIKASGKPGQAWHQDEQFIPTRDRSLTGAWIALDDATVENGCLWALPGSHRAGVIYPQRPQDDPRFDCSDEAYLFPFSDDEAVPLDVKAGTVVFFNGYLLHRSLPNRSQGAFRRVLVNHYMSAASLLPWSLSGQADMRETAMADYRDVVLVAGVDPYAWKGTEHLAEPHVRRDREGGCRPVAA